MFDEQEKPFENFTWRERVIVLEVQARRVAEIIGIMTALDLRLRALERNVYIAFGAVSAIQIGLTLIRVYGH